MLKYMCVRFLTQETYGSQLPGIEKDSRNIGAQNKVRTRHS